MKYFWWHLHPQNSYLYKDLYIDVSCIMINYPISSNLCKKFLGNVIDFTIFHLEEAAARGVLLEKVFLEISQNSQEDNCGKVFFNKVAGWGDCFWSFSCLLLKISCLFHFNRKMRWKKGNTLMEFKYLLFCLSIDLFDIKNLKRNLTDGNLIKKCV